MIDAIQLEFTTNASGVASKTTPTMHGRFSGFHLKLGTATASDVTITNHNGLQLYSKAGLNASAIHLVRSQVVGVDGTALTFDGTRIMADALPVVGPLTVAIANGGNAKTLTVVIYVES